MKRLTALLTTLTVMLMLEGCAMFEALKARPEQPAPRPSEVVVAPYNGNALHNFYMGRQYVAEGRYELAREHYLLALASAREETMRDALVAELQSVDRLIKTLR
ncbi:hypothetical protein N1030_02430 [Desulfovibrio mangrovi]|uniref:hypothetical protein n=1 Tax=Desulfovibrio mangrovi TaxID=2976983 RepID=UPI0022479D9F|nr:hypothetical protein [Desulfovibrio mangrovi]UZP67851.1 hypothetical protein N1030_02430 [Desulfovibrio mangrovi]